MSNEIAVSNFMRMYFMSATSMRDRDVSINQISECRANEICILGDAVSSRGMRGDADKIMVAD